MKYITYINGAGETKIHCCEDTQEQWQKWAVLIASVLFAGVAFWGIANAIVTFPEAIAEYDSQYAEVTGQK